MPQPNADTSQDGREKPTALIVENNMILSLLYESYLEQLGFEVIDNLVYGRNAVDKAITTHPDLILMDILLDGPMDGVQAALTINERINVPVLFITAHSDRKRKEQASQLENSAYLEKPISFEKVREEVIRLIGPLENYT